MKDIDLGPFSDFRNLFGDLLKSEESRISQLHLFSKNLYVGISKDEFGSKEDVEEELEIVKGFSTVNKLPLIYLLDGRKNQGTADDAIPIWTTNASNYVRNSILFFEEGNKMEETMNFISSIVRYFPGVNPPYTLTKSLKTVEMQLVKSLKINPAIKIFEKLKGKNLETDLKIIWAIAQGGRNLTWQVIGESCGLSDRGAEGRWTTKIKDVVKTNSAVILFGLIKKLALSGIKLPFEFVDYTDGQEIDRFYSKLIE